MGRISFPLPSKTLALPNKPVSARQVLTAFIQKADAIRGDLREDTETDQAVPRVDDSTSAEIFKAPNISAYVKGEYGDANAVENAKNRLVEQMKAFNFENQFS